MIQSADLRKSCEGTVVSVLPDEVKGLVTSFVALPENQAYQAEIKEDTGLVYLFTGGMGRVEQGDNSWEITEIALFVPLPGGPFKITAANQRLDVLELAVAFSAEDRELYQENKHKIQSFQTYSSCGTYKERIKSARTISRTLLPEYTFPRLCIGSVETTGPDQVAAHQHPMLEQLFYGLKDNCCTVRADQQAVAFTERQLIHIPLGSNHGVEVSAGKKLHYIWIDLFKHQKGMEWIAQQHVHDE